MAVSTERAHTTKPDMRPTVSNRKKVIAAAVALGLIIALGAFLRFYQLGVDGVGNTYYAATVQSMLTSWSNFFFVSFEPGGSVSVDKPPLGFWLQAVSAYFLGVNGFALALPQALAGVLAVPLLYVMVKRPFGVGAGLVAALALAVTPVAVSTERNNTIDGLLVFVLLLATWAFLEAIYRGKLRYLLLGAVLVGLGFNVKMLQALMPVPAFYAVYMLSAPHAWWKRFIHLVLASFVLLVVSLSWAVVVDLTPADERPFVGSSDNNTVMELIVGHNGLSRLTAGGGNPRPRPPAAGQLPAGKQQRQFFTNQLPAGGQFNANPPLPSGAPQPDALAVNRPQMAGGDGGLVSNPPGGRNPRTNETGFGALRLFSEPQGTEAGWLLPFALLGLPVILVVVGWRWPLTDKHLALVLWAGWLLPTLFYFSFTTGLFHAYYLIMLGPPIAALAGATAWALRDLARQRVEFGWILAPLLVGITLLFQLITLWDYAEHVSVVIVAAVITLLAAAAALAAGALFSAPRVARTALVIVLLIAFVAPLVWSATTTLNASPNFMLPRSGPGDQAHPGDQRGTHRGEIPETESALINYLLDNTDPDSYLLATVRANDAAPFILATLRPVLALGGFMGSDAVVDVDEFIQMVADGELRFIFTDGLAQRKPEINTWVSGNCSVVDLPFLAPGGSAGTQARPGAAAGLYDCGDASG